ncbi:MAG: hypothetical protein KatS3mg087_1805 [Patescibacteria group bacterium]|nr:MAG: hypothetical protein KatS3mg087_1805 [Patescibacteria group bacterium]
MREEQEKLNRVTRFYNELLEPLQKRLSQISEARRIEDENKELRELNRVIANEAAGATRKRMAQLRIEEIMLERRIRQTENQRDTELDAIQSSVDSAEKELDMRREAYQLILDRIRAQNEQISLYGEEQKAIERLRKEMERLAKEAREKLLKPFQDAIKRAQLLAEEVKDTIDLFRARYELTSSEATEAQKAAAAIEEQSIFARRALREIELAELGVPREQIDRLRSLVVTLADIGVEGKGL